MTTGETLDVAKFDLNGQAHDDKSNDWDVTVLWKQVALNQLLLQIDTQRNRCPHLYEYMYDINANNYSEINLISHLWLHTNLGGYQCNGDWMTSAYGSTVLFMIKLILHFGKRVLFFAMCVIF